MLERKVVPLSKVNPRVQSRLEHIRALLQIFFEKTPTPAEMDRVCKLKNLAAVLKYRMEMIEISGKIRSHLEWKMERFRSRGVLRKYLKYRKLRKMISSEKIPNYLWSDLKLCFKIWEFRKKHNAAKKKLIILLRTEGSEELKNGNTEASIFLGKIRCKIRKNSHKNDSYYY